MIESAEIRRPLSRSVMESAVVQLGSQSAGPELGGSTNLGNSLQITTFADDRHVMILGLALAEASIPLGSLGTLRLDPTVMLVSSRQSVNRVPQLWSIQIPNDNRLLGLTLSFQGLDAPAKTTVSPRFTRLLRVEVVK